MRPRRLHRTNFLKGTASLYLGAINRVEPIKLRFRSNARILMASFARRTLFWTTPKLFAGNVDVRIGSDLLPPIGFQPYPQQLLISFAAPIALNAMSGVSGERRLGSILGSRNTFQLIAPRESVLPKLSMVSR